MKTLSRTSLIGAFALVASLSAPLAFAQSAEASTQASPPTEAAAQTETSAQGTTAAAETTATAAPAETTAATASETDAAPAKKSWSDVDADKDGKLTKSEASAVPALSKVFDKADGNADGALTADEYKAYAAEIQGGGKSEDGGK